MLMARVLKAESQKNIPLHLEAIRLLTALRNKSSERTSEMNLKLMLHSPEKYQAENLAGKPAVFKCKLNGIKKKKCRKQMMSLKDVTDFSTLEEYKTDIEKTLKTKKENAAKTAKEDEVVKKIVENSTMDVPETMIETKQSQIIEQFTNRLRYQGLDLKQYLQFTNSTPEQFKDSVKPEAEKKN